jgi:hypothetical protein
VGQRDESNLEPVEDRLARLELKLDQLLALQSSAVSVETCPVPQQVRPSVESTPVV